MAQRTSKGWTQFYGDIAVRLTAEGFRDVASEPRAFQFLRWIASLSGTRALKQADEFDELLETGAYIVS